MKFLEEPSGLKLGLLVNFGAYPKATIIRLAL